MGVGFVKQVGFNDD